MSVQLQTLLDDLNRELQPARFKDYCPNGLQVEGRSEVRKLITGVTASQALIDAALLEQADAILVHHGYFWQGENPVITGTKRRRLRTLLQNELSLIAYHLPLDAHASLGNNVQLAAAMGWRLEGSAGTDGKAELVQIGRLATAMNGDSLRQSLHSTLGREPLHIPGRADVIERLAWCTGAAQGFIEIAVDCGVDAYITGEVSEQTVHVARENGLHFFAAGHHATERYGVQALGRYLARRHDIEHRFIDIDNPV